MESLNRKETQKDNSLEGSYQAGCMSVTFSSSLDRVSLQERMRRQTLFPCTCRTGISISDSSHIESELKNLINLYFPLEPLLVSEPLIRMLPLDIPTRKSVCTSFEFVIKSTGKCVTSFFPAFNYDWHQLTDPITTGISDSISF